MAVSENKPLTEKQKAFVEAYIENGCKNPSGAATRVGLHKNSGKVMLAKAYIQRAIARRQQEILFKANADFQIWTPEQLLAEYQKIASNLDEKTSDRLRALDSMSRYYGLFTEKIKIETVNYSDAISEARQRIQDLQALEHQENSTVDGQLVAVDQKPIGDILTGWIPGDPLPGDEKAGAENDGEYRY